MSEWKEYKLGEVIQLIGGGTPKTTNSDYWGGDIPWLSVGDFNKGRKYVYEAEKHITQEGLNNSSTKILHKDDIIISARGTVGVVAMIGCDMAFNQSCYGIRGKEIVDQQYLYYLLIHSVQGLKQNAYGGVFDTITRETFDLIDISLPPIEEQRRIAGVLGALDEKIDLLSRENATLEALAETLFRHHFIENPNPTWKEGKLGELIIISSGKGLKRTDFVDNGLYAVLGANGEIGRTNEYLIGENDKVLYTGRVGTLGNVFRVESERVWLSDNTLVIKPKKYYNYVYFLLKQANLQDYDVGSTQPLIRQSDIVDIDIIIPPDDWIKKYECEVIPLFEKIKSNQQHMQTLASQRDTLLPRLMSGEVKVTGQ